MFSAARRALNTENIAFRIALYDSADAAAAQDLLGRKIRLLDLCTLNKAWLKPVKKLLYAAPLVDSDARALTLLHYLRRYPENAQLVRKLQFGEGSSNDIVSWTSPDLMPALISACPCLEHLNFGVLGNTDPAKLFDALPQCKLLRYLGFHDALPYPWFNATAFFDFLQQKLPHLTHLKVFGLLGGPETPDVPPQDCLEAGQGLCLQSASLFYCHMTKGQLSAALRSSAGTLRRLYLEAPRKISSLELLEVLAEVGSNLVYLGVESFRVESLAASTDSTPSDASSIALSLPGGEVASIPTHAVVPAVHAIDGILKCCKSLQILDFHDGSAGLELMRAIDSSKLTRWRFTCASDVFADDWVDTFKALTSRRAAKCWVTCSGWSEADTRRVRIEAWKVGISWLSAEGDEVPGLSDDSSE